MIPSKLPLFAIAAALIGVLPLTAQESSSLSAEGYRPPPDQRVASTGGISPHETFSVVIGGRSGGRVTVVYGRPYSKNPKTGEMRQIWGGLVPYGKVWRMGSDEATLFITQKPLDFSGTTIPAGAYTLFLLPKEDGSAQLIFNKQIGQWGLQYNPSEDFARVDLQKGSLDTRVDQFTMAISRQKGGGVLELKWENTQYSAPFTLAK